MSKRRRTGCLDALERCLAERALDAGLMTLDAGLEAGLATDALEAEHSATAWDGGLEVGALAFDAATAEFTLVKVRNHVSMRQHKVSSECEINEVDLTDLTESSCPTGEYEVGEAKYIRLL
jgi:hypothetical protein